MGATRIEVVEFAVPAGTPKATPVQALLFAQRAQVVNIQVKVPPGPSGLAGFSFWHSSEQVVPKIGGTWVVADDETLEFPLDDMAQWPDWRIKGYNTDVYAHTFYVRVFLDDRVPAPSLTLTLQPIE